jgi:GNAT superfamily N-acetyltransferase
VISFAHEDFSRVRPEYAAFVHRYWDNTPENADEEPLDFNWQVYVKLDEEKMLHLHVGRDQGMMVCAALYTVMYSPKRKKQIIAHCDTFAVARDYRGLGIGKLLYEAVEPALIAKGVHVIHNSYREVYHTKPLFEKLGFVLEDRVYSKKVG